jgi:hypothetical protein
MKINKARFWLNAIRDIRIFSLFICIFFPQHRTIWSIRTIRPDCSHIFNFSDEAWNTCVYGRIPEIKGPIRYDDVVLLIQRVRYDFPLIVISLSHFFYQCVELYVKGNTSCLLSPYCFSTSSSLVITFLLYLARLFGFLTRVHSLSPLS